MKKIFSIILFSVVIEMSYSTTWVGAGKALVITPVILDTVTLYITGGESNSGGAANAGLVDSENVALPELQILNNNTYVFEDYLHGTNNNIGHTGLTSATFGYEIRLAQRIRANHAFYGAKGYYVQTGSGGSYISAWVDANRNPTTLFNTRFKAAVDTATKLLSVHHVVRKVIFLSIGINDLSIPTVADTFFVYMKAHINNMRAVTGSNTPVIITKFTSSYTGYNSKIDSLASTMDSVYAVDGAIPSGGGSPHWNYVGYAGIMDEFLAIIEGW